MTIDSFANRLVCDLVAYEPGKSMGPSPHANVTLRAALTNARITPDGGQPPGRRKSTWKLVPCGRTSLLAFCLAVVPATGATLATLPFQGSHTESFESFPIGTRAEPGGMPWLILGGAGRVDEGNQAPFFLRDLFIYVTANDFFTPNRFGLGSSAAKVADGNRGLGHSSSEVNVRIELSVPVDRFGGYWGGSATNGISFSFYGTAGELIQQDQVFWQNPGGNGVLEWAGWEFSKPVSRIEYSGSFIVVDSLRIQTVPESATALYGLPAGLLAFLRSRRPRSRS
jgi:hypothetical protein